MFAESKIRIDPCKICLYVGLMHPKTGSNEIKLKHLIFGPYNPIIGWFKGDPNIGSIHESNFWIACSNYRLNHPIYEL